VAENCDGVSFNCPVDVFAGTGVTCTDEGNPCTADHCDGSGTCIHPAGNAGAVCRPATGDCDLVEVCGGTNTSCPADAFKPSGASCGSNVDTDCDNPDTCDGSNNCLANNEPNGTTCNDGDPCTDGETCTGGVCGGGTNTCPALDHYKCYQGKDLKNPKFTKLTGVNTTDQITTEAVEVKKLKFVCVPVDKNGEGINNPNAHLACYQVKATNLTPRPSVEVVTQFQTSHFQLKKGKLICLPATKTVIP
jgi:hypothetical protein